MPLAVVLRTDGGWLGFHSASIQCDALATTVQSASPQFLEKPVVVIAFKKPNCTKSQFWNKIRTEKFTEAVSLHELAVKIHREFTSILVEFTSLLVSF